jgi:hypothetical protein
MDISEAQTPSRDLNLWSTAAGPPLHVLCVGYHGEILYHFLATVV